MGADGGINWCVVTDRDKLGRFYYLIGPFPCFTEWHDFNGSNAEWKREYYGPKKFYDKSIVLATYGTNQEFQGLDSLKEVVDEILWGHSFDDLEAKHWPFRNLSWLECLEEIETRPWSSFFRSDVEKVIMNCLYDHKRVREDIIEKYNNVLSMKIDDWAKEIGCIINIGYVECEETWT
jgi:hypothetical protein